jgi:hypothetical protein
VYDEGADVDISGADNSMLDKGLHMVDHTYHQNQ